MGNSKVEQNSRKTGKQKSQKKGEKQKSKKKGEKPNMRRRANVGIKIDRIIRNSWKITHLKPPSSQYYVKQMSKKKVSTQQKPCNVYRLWTAHALDGKQFAFIAYTNLNN